MIYLAAVLAALSFMVALRWLNIVPIAAGVVETTRAATRTMKDRNLNDADKERLVQKASVTLMGSFVSIVVRAAVAVAAGLLPILALDGAGLLHADAVVGLLATWQGISLTSAVMTIACFGGRRSWMP